jgi:hypothetical protein
MGNNSQAQCLLTKCVCSFFYKSREEDTKCSVASDCHCKLDWGKLVLLCVVVLGVLALIFAEVAFWKHRHHRAQYGGMD